VACGTADVTAEAIGSGVREEGDLLLMYGSTLFMLQRVDQFIPRPSLWPSFLLNNSQPTVLAGTSNAGSVLDWVLREIHSEGNALTAFESASKVPPGCEGLICLPYFAGERSPIFDPYASGIFLGLRMHHTRAHMLRAVMEGIGYSFLNLLDNFGANGVFPKKVFASGGGTNNKIWTQIMSDISGVDQQISRVSQGAAIGAAYLGGMAAGVFKRNQSMPQTWLNGHTEIKVSATAHKKYREQYPFFLEAYQKNKILMHQLIQK
jgi:xylulokinase